MESKLIGVIEEQIAVQFTGKINILSTYNRQFLGNILFREGQLIKVSFNGLNGFKAFNQLIIQEYALQSFDYVVEPELVNERDRDIHYPFSVIKIKTAEMLKLHRESLKARPPENVKILVDAEFLEDSLPVTATEFEVLETLTEWNSPYDIYNNCELMDHEITWALVSLRKKGAFKIIGPKDGFSES